MGFCKNKDLLIRRKYLGSLRGERAFSKIKFIRRILVRGYSLVCSRGRLLVNRLCLMKCLILINRKLKIYRLCRIYQTFYFHRDKNKIIFKITHILFLLHLNLMQTEWHKGDSLILILNIQVKDWKASHLVTCQKFIMLHKVVRNEEVNLLELKIQIKML